MSCVNLSLVCEVNSLSQRGRMCWFEVAQLQVDSLGAPLDGDPPLLDRLQQPRLLRPLPLLCSRPPPLVPLRLGLRLHRLSPQVEDLLVVLGDQREALRRMNQSSVRDLDPNAFSNPTQGSAIRWAPGCVNAAGKLREK